MEPISTGKGWHPSLTWPYVPAYRHGKSIGMVLSGTHDLTAPEHQMLWLRLT